MTFLGTWPLLKSSGEILLQRTPRSLESKLAYIYQDLNAIHGVLGTGKMHFWELNQNEYVCSIVLQISRTADEHEIILICQNILRNHSINNCNIQLEKDFNFKV
jgi:zinc transporter 5/7